MRADPGRPALVAAELRRAGLRVRTGPDRLVAHVRARPSSGSALGATGALAVDMESAWFAEALGSVAR